MEIDAWANLQCSKSPESRRQRFGVLFRSSPAGSRLRTMFMRSKVASAAFAAWSELAWSDISRGMGREQPSNRDELQMRALQ